MTNNTSQAERTEDKFGLERLIFFSDAVVAIAITLLVLDLKVPELVATASNDQLAAALWALVPKFIGYCTSFWVIGAFWLAHHRMFRVIVRYDNRLLLLNLLFLFSIAFVPFPTAVLYSFPIRTVTVELYAATMVAIGVTSNVMLYYAARNHRLVGPEYTWVKASAAIRRGLWPPLVFFVSMLLAPWNADWAINIWWLLLIVYLVIGLRQRDADGHG